jgi:hypothetical protein
MMSLKTMQMDHLYSLMVVVLIYRDNTVKNLQLTPAVICYTVTCMWCT